MNTESEIRKFKMAMFINENIIRFEISVNEIELMHRLDRHDLKNFPLPN